MKVCILNGQGHMTKMATMAIAKTFKKSFYPEPEDL